MGRNRFAPSLQFRKDLGIMRPCIEKIHKNDSVTLHSPTDPKFPLWQNGDTESTYLTVLFRALGDEYDST